MGWKSKSERNAGETCGLCEYTNLPRECSNEEFIKFVHNNPLICIKTGNEVEGDNWCEEFETAKEITANLPPLPDEDKE